MNVSKVFEFTVYNESELEQILLQILKKKTLSDTTKRQIARKLSQWTSYLELKTLNNLLRNPEDSISALESTDKIKHSPTNHHIYISSAVAYIKYVTKDTQLLEKWKQIEHKNSEPLADHYDKNKPTEKQSDKVITLEELDKKRNELQLGSTERLLIAFYTLIEPIRADYYATEIILPDPQTKELKDATEDNYIILTPSSAKLVVKDFKTKHKYHTIENELSPALVEELRSSLEKTPRKYLFTMEDNIKPFTRKLFSNWACRTLTRILKRPMTLTAMRHAYITDKIQSKTAAEELAVIAKKMGHSRSIQRVYEWQ